MPTAYIVTNDGRSAPAAERIVERSADVVELGEVVGVFGVRGAVKVFSYTRPRDNILSYSPWLVSVDRETWRAFDLEEGHVRGRGLVARLDGVVDRDHARSLTGARIGVTGRQLPAPPENEIYWHELVGMTVRLGDGKILGTLSGMLETPANDVMVVSGERERLIPFVRGHYVLEIDRDERCVTVDWHVDD